jgi:hypothetical protein
MKIYNRNLDWVLQKVFLPRWVTQAVGENPSMMFAQGGSGDDSNKVRVGRRRKPTAPAGSRERAEAPNGNDQQPHPPAFLQDKAGVMAEEVPGRWAVQGDYLRSPVDCRG